MNPKLFLFVFALSSSLVVACSGQSPDAIDVSRGDAGDADAGPLACGDAVCATNELCIRPCCGGALRACAAPVDGGGCGEGNALGSCVGPSGPTIGCAPTCAPKPFCSAKRVCPVGAPAPDGRDVQCACF